MPVGEDQRQHIELTRDLGQRFNSRFGDTFAMPEVVDPERDREDLRPAGPDGQDVEVGRHDKGIIWLLDEPSVTAKKIKSAVTDNDGEVRFDRDEKPGVSNLLTILSVLGGSQHPALEAEFAGRGYGDLKTATADVVVAAFEPVRARALELLDDPAELDRVLAGNADRAEAIAQATLERVYDRVGFLRRGRRVRTAVVLFDLDDTLFAHRESVERGIAAHRSTLGGALAAADRPPSSPAGTRLEELHYHRYLTGELDFLGQRRERAPRLRRAVRAAARRRRRRRLVRRVPRALRAAWTLHDDVARRASRRCARRGSA